MNTKNNRRRQQSQEKIEKAFVELLRTREITTITISDLCKMTDLNRSTFYANYCDIYDLADRISEKLEAEVSKLYENDFINNCANDYLRLFCHIRENQMLYNTYFKLGYDNRQNLPLDAIQMDSSNLMPGQLEYHIEFHRAGLNAIIKKWLKGGCAESPETMVEIIEREYSGRKIKADL